ncbi:Trimethyllysine dioxygenase [Trametes cingulata]|nr:Trimethyllysine dioxygenase [Trametes cingulata]
MRASKALLQYSRCLRVAAAGSSRNIPVARRWKHIPGTASAASFSSSSIARTPRPSTPSPSTSQGSSEVAPAPPTSRIDDRKVVLGWDTTTYSRYHHIWLRDHCRCPQCFHPITKQRLLNTFDIPADIKPTHVESKPEGLEVHWPSSQPHTSLYPWSWLRHNSYDPPLARPPPTEYILWGAKILQDPPLVTYEEAMAQDGRGLYKWLSNVFGFCFVSGVPATPEATEGLSRRIGFIRETQYGTFWDFTSDLAKGDTAYTTLALGAHTDTTYFTDPCGLQLFHLLEHSGGTGGATLLVDGFYVASILKELHPEAYELLSTVPVPTHAAGEPEALYTPSTRSTPVLKHEDGELVQVRWNNDDRSVLRNLRPDQVEPWYDAIRLWYKLLSSPDSEYWVQLSPGTAVVVDNHRVLHGRSAFTGKRRMCGAYIGTDEYRSKLAVLSERFAPDPVTQDTAATASVNGRSIWHPAL